MVVSLRDYGIPLDTLVGPAGIQQTVECRDEAAEVFLVGPAPPRFGIGGDAGEYLSLHIFDARYPFAPHLATAAQQQGAILAVDALREWREGIGFLERELGIVVVEIGVAVR